MIIQNKNVSDEPRAQANRRMTQMVEKLKAREYRLTPQRLAVVRILAENDEHPTVEKIHARVKVDFPTTSLATVYKTLVVLKELGEVLEIGFSDGSNRYDGVNPRPHPHLICTRCGRIQDPDMDFLDGLTDRVTAATGFRITKHRLDFFGLCADCQGAASGGVAD
jgi:Fur family peroxide stress response transcriptional regulator